MEVSAQILSIYGPSDHPARGTSSVRTHSWRRKLDELRESRHLQRSKARERMPELLSLSKFKAIKHTISQRQYVVHESICCFNRERQRVERLETYGNDLNRGSLNGIAIDGSSHSWSADTTLAKRLMHSHIDLTLTILSVYRYKVITTHSMKRHTKPANSKINQSECPIYSKGEYYWEDKVDPTP